ncbi:hypothetical protein [Parageobacillus thermoglucosidasius]|uniref:Uncharacterized protein n=2 Tax=Anoxybacillaceae TaxID=3120669 RepID=A0AAN1D734_PARTM|nr:hypothetical protein [Parageobacillus thermoglucosidasius]KYD17297.1 hypothetical protein B4168_1697 [Anoxybacillus flavithermus]REK53983.1 MAG: hypothetical protein C6P36_15285 [Geobacillus sp.]AEH48285.1 hypothetical protein Geoth_2361 [Parageobacillus thermoglucosidasius C56-YS93]ALF10491.1 hypothetical protein AOT13_10965 [Parageobacillus thermoglucosidasius]ANZ30571.1 hypothetical protein BCV53_10980 [Parageobacillus thermoglucosidasius]
MTDSIFEIEHKIRALEREIQEIKERWKEIKSVKEQERKGVDHANISAIAYFTYSFLLPKGDEQKGVVIGSFVIHNIGSAALETPVICLKVTPKECAVLSAKLGEDVQYDRRLNPLVMEPWQYIDENMKKMVEERGEFWIKPVRVSQIEPGQKLAFSNFQLKFDISRVQTSYKMEGFFYCKQLQNGIRALNNIVIHV